MRKKIVYSKKLTIYILPLFLACIGVAVMSSWNTHGTAKSLLLNANAQDPRSELTVELNNNGFSPSELQHRPGTFGIAVHNKTISGDYTLRLVAEDGTVLHEINVQKGSTAWTVNLQTGTYTLTETNHPQWTCSIVVQ